MKKIDESGWLQIEITDLEKKRRGRPSIGTKAKKFKTVGLTEDEWRWLEMWLPGASPTSQLQELVERARKFWPAGPAKFR